MKFKSERLIRNKIKELIELSTSYKNRNYILNQVLILKWVIGDRKTSWLRRDETYDKAIPELKRYLK